MKKTQRGWTEEEYLIAVELLQAKAGEAEFQERLGRTKIACYAKWERETFLSRLSKAEPTEQFTVPVEAWVERSRRLAEPRSITASLFGDPPLSQSALGKRMAGAAT